MDQDTRPAPFNIGDHLRYIGAQKRSLPAGAGADRELVLAPEMEGVVLSSTGAFPDQPETAPEPWRCRVQFHNGFQLDITPQNYADFELTSQADTVKLHFIEAGRGTPLLLLHGFPLSGAIWAEQQKQLAEHYRVIVPDLRGHGQSPAPAGVYEMSLMARDVFALLDALEIQQAVIMGHSMGGYVALAGFKMAPQRFLGLGLIASQIGADADEARQNRYRTAAKVAAEGSKVVAAAMLPKLFAPSLSPKAAIVEQARQIILNNPVTGIAGALKGMAIRPDSHSLLANFKIPVLIVAGAEDQIIALDKAKALAASLPTATFTTIANAGHMPMLEQPAATTAAIREFLQKPR